jgi:5,10-methylenetetrahydromethanopterin reductase
MRIDIILEPDKSADEVVELGKLAENLGFGAIWMPNKLDGKDPFASFSVLARETSTIKMGPIAVSPFELHPIKMATSLLTLNEISNGRAVIVVGGGGGTIAAMGIKPERRMPAIKECIEIVRAAAKGEHFDYAGEIYEVHGYEPTWVTQPAPLLYVGANKHKVMAFSAEVGDGIMMSDIPQPIVADYIKFARDRLDEQGKSKKDFPINNFFAWHVKKDKEDARREARRWLVLRGMLFPMYLRPFLNEDEVQLVCRNKGAFFKAYATNTHIIEGVPDEVVNKLVDGLTLWGGLEDMDCIIEELRDFESKGLNEIALRIYEDPADCIRLIGEKIIPALN